MSAQPARDATPGDAFARAVRRVKVQRELPPTPGREIVQVLREDRAEPSLHAVPGGDATRPLVVVIGAGFAGMSCVDGLRDTPVDVLLLDEHDYRLFTPLLYQVASSLLDSSEVTTPIRGALHGARNVRFRQARVDHVDPEMRQVVLCDTTRITYDTCVLASGSTPNFYGNLSVAAHACTLYGLGDALDLRGHVTSCLEQAATCPRSDLAQTRLRSELLTFCIVGAGPTGVEFAGALTEFFAAVIPQQYPELDLAEIRVLLIEGTGRLLPQFDARLSTIARAELERRGVEVRTNTFVNSVDDRSITLVGLPPLASSTVVWTAGVRAVNLLTRGGGRIAVDDHFRVIGVRSVYAIGDTAAGHGSHDNVLPVLSPPAIQAGRYVASEILRGPAPKAFRYRDKGSLATIGRGSAVGHVGPVPVRGRSAWLIGLAVHLYYLAGPENRAHVLLRWAWRYSQSTPCGTVATTTRLRNARASQRRASIATTAAQLQ